MDHLCYLCLVFVMLSRLFIAALWSPAGKGLISWLLFVIINCILSLSHAVSKSLSPFLLLFTLYMYILKHILGNIEHLTHFILDTGKQVLWQTVKSQMKCRIRQHFIRGCSVC